MRTIPFYGRAETVPLIPFFFGGAAAVVAGHEFPEIVASSLGMVSGRQPADNRRPRMPETRVERLRRPGGRRPAARRAQVGDR